jgi:hypothetical protein
VRDAFRVFRTFQSSSRKRGSGISKRIAHWRGADDAAPPKAAEAAECHAEGFGAHARETLRAWRLWARAYARRQVRATRGDCSSTEIHGADPESGSTLRLSQGFSVKRLGQLANFGSTL